jgi:CheY-like chemotaxis protein
MSTRSPACKDIVLIVEDEALLRMAAVCFVEEAGFEAIEASDADEAVAFLQSRDDIRLVFTDIDMPTGSMNGLRLAAAVRMRWPPIKIILVSGLRIPEKNDLPAGTKFFSKPYDQDHMVAVMYELLEAA